MKSYGLSPAARRDLGDIVSYIARDNPSAAYRLRDVLFAAFDALAAQPGMGHVREDLTARAVRFWPVLRRYTVVYRTRESTIEIVRVFGRGRDVATLLR